MTKPTTTIPISAIILDEEIYPRKGIDPKRVAIFAENLRDGFKFDPIEVEPDPDHPGSHRPLQAGSGLIHSRSARRNPDGYGPQAIPHEPPRHPPRQDRQQIGFGSDVTPLPFGENGNTAKSAK